jgi:hypothetical protein
MTHRRSQKVPEAIVQLQQELERFRSANPTRMRLPEPLWQSAVNLARQYGDLADSEAAALGLHGPEEAACRR